MLLARITEDAVVPDASIFLAGKAQSVEVNECYGASQEVISRCKLSHI